MRVIVRILHALAALPTPEAKRRVLLYIATRLQEADRPSEEEKQTAVDRFITKLEEMAKAEHAKRMARDQVPFDFDGGPATVGGAPGRETVRDGA